MINLQRKKIKNFYNKKKIFLTGGSGFVGIYVINYLLYYGAKITVVTRNSKSKELKKLKKKITIINLDINNYDKLVEKVKGHHFVINLAASVAGIEYNKKHSASIFQDNLQLFFNIIKASKENKIKKFLTVSSACVYPRYCSIPTPEKEGFYGEPEPTNSGYGWSKRMQEYLSKKYFEEFGLKTLIIRPYNCYGPGDNFNNSSSHVIAALIKKAINSKKKLKVWGKGNHTRSFLYVDDFARGLVEFFAMFNKSEPVNLGNNEEISIKNLAEIICKKIKEIQNKELKIIFEKNKTTGQPRRKGDLRKIKKIINFKTNYTLEEGIKKTIQYYIKKK